MNNWNAISTIPDHIKNGDEFLARWADCMGHWQVCIAYYGQFGDCFMTVPMGYLAGAEKWLDEGQGIDGTGFGIGAPDISPTEWCEIPC